MSANSAWPSGGPPAPLHPLVVQRCAVLEPFVAEGLLDAAAVHLASAIARNDAAVGDEVLLAAAFCVRALQLGHVCVELASLPGTVEVERTGDITGDGPGRAALPWPEPRQWARALERSASVAVVDPTDAAPSAAVGHAEIRPLVFDGTRVYLERYFRYEREVGDALLRELGAGTGAASGAGGHAHPLREELLDRYFVSDRAAGTTPGPDAQRSAAGVALGRHVTVMAGGPGTGKTYTIARMLAVALHEALESGDSLEVALAAPTGKAAARMGEAVEAAIAGLDPPAEVARQIRAVEPSTIHRLLGYRDGIRFRHDHDNPLPHDLVVLDETSMVSLPLMARLLDALREEARLVLVGDPFQLASVEAGAVLGDIVGPVARTEGPVEGPLAEGITMLTRTHRFAEQSGIHALASAVRHEDLDAVLGVLTGDEFEDVAWIDPEDAGALARLNDSLVSDAVEVVSLARDGEAEAALRVASDTKVICGSRRGRFGSHGWGDAIEAAIGARSPAQEMNRGWYVGRPVMVTRNDYATGVFNGDTGVVVERDGRTLVALADGPNVRTVPLARLESLSSWWSTTIHKSQGSEFSHAVVSLPEVDSPILTNELLYTGVTRGRDRVSLVGSIDAITAAVRRRISRASGLGARLWPNP